MSLYVLSGEKGLEAREERKLSEGVTNETKILVF